jgi:hypothetical protein
VSRAADGKAKLTVALDGARAQQRPWNRRWVSVDGGGAPCSRGQSERERERESWAVGANVRGEVGEQGAGLGRGWRMHGRGRVHDREIVGKRLEMADRWGRWDREREWARGGGRGREWRRQLWPTGQREREKAR